MDQEMLQETHTQEEDEDLLDSDNQENEIENLIYKQNLQMLDENGKSDKKKEEKQMQEEQKNHREQQQTVIITQKSSDKDSNEFEFEQFMKEHEFNLNLKLDSERSQFTQESFSDPESARDNIGQGTQKSLSNKNQENNAQRLREILRLKEQDSTNNKVDASLSKIINDMDDEEEKQLGLHKQNTGSFSLMGGQSPSRDSMQGSFQGHITSNFPQNLKDTQLYKLRDPATLIMMGGIIESQQQLQQIEQEYKSSNVSSSDNTFNPDGDRNSNNSFYKFEVQKIKDFEKSTMIKFEEFEGDNTSQLESDPNRKYSERISDRIYERTDNNNATKDEDPFAGYFQSSSEENTQEYQNQQLTQSPFNEKRQLYVITEEDVSEEDKLLISSADFLRVHNQQDYNSREQIYHKSKSQPIDKGGRHSINKSSTAEKRDSRLKTDYSATNQQSPQQQFFTSQPHPFNPNVSNPDKSRLSQDSPFLQNDQDQISQYFQRQGINNYLRHSNNNINNGGNTSQPDFLMSEEDLLSNVDRISKILPTNEISEEDERKEDEYTLFQRFKESKQLVEHLKCENQNKNTLLMIKESQINLLQMKNEELEEQIQKLQQEMEDQTMPRLIIKPQMKDVDTQVNEFERKKIREKKKFSTGLKKTPSRIQQDLYQDYTDITSYLNKNQPNHFDTPQIKNDLSFKESPTTSQKKGGGHMSKQQSMSFGSEDLNQFKQQLQQLKSQLIKSEENNLMFQQKVEKYKSDKNDLKEKYFQANSEKNEFMKKFDKFQQEVEQSQKKIEGLKAENLDTRRQIDIYQLKYENPNSKVDQNTNTNKAITVDQHVQTEFLYTKKDHQPLAKKSDIFIFEDKEDQKDINSTFTSKSLKNQNITIINSNKQDLNLLLEKARDYEQISSKLQNEINQHRRLLKDNQFKMQQDMAQHKDYKKKIKKRDQKLDKYRQRIKVLETENLELKMRVEEYNQKVSDTRIKMEAKVQEKEFKIISLKNQMKHISLSSGLLTPATPNVGGRMMSQNELYGVINSIIQQSFQQQQISQRFDQSKLRAKSQEHPYQNTVSASFYDDALMEEPKIMTPNHVMLGENPSFCNNENHTANTMYFTNQNDKMYNTPSAQQVSNINRSFKNQSNFAQSGTFKDSQHLQHIFSSSMKRIQEELDSIKDFNSSGNIQLNNLLKNNYQQDSLNNNNTKIRQSSKIIGQTNQHQSRPPISQDNYNFQPIIYEDSLQTQQELRNQQQSHPELLAHDASSEISSYVDHKIEQMRQKRLSEHSIKRFNNRSYPIKAIDTDQIQKRNVSHQNTHTFRQISTQGKNSPKKNLQQQFEINEQPLFNQTQAFNEKEQNASIFYDLKPQFDNSNFTNTSGFLNQTQTQIKNLKANQDHQSSVKFESKKASLNNSIKNPAAFQHHIRLNSNLKRDTEIEESSDEFESSKDSYRRKFKSINEQNTRIQNSQYSALIKYDDSMPKSNQQSLRAKNTHSINPSSNNIIINSNRHQQQHPIIHNQPQHLLINLRQKNSPNDNILIDGSRSTLSNYSQKLDDLKKKYGRLN